MELSGNVTETEESNSEKMCLVLNDLEEAISKGHFDRVKRLISDLIDYECDGEYQVGAKNNYNNANNSLITNLIISACKHNKVNVVNYLFDNDVEISNNLCSGGGILPDAKDEAGHNAFYYAIRWGNIRLLDGLINKWPHRYFTVRSQDLDEVISRAYEELKLRNVPLAQEMEIFVEKELINLRFFSDAHEQDKSVKYGVDNIRQRVELVVRNVNLLEEEYLDVKEVDEKFLFVLKFIARNLHVLKRQLKSTYDRLPWEEMEFCLVGFVSSYIKRHKINIFYKATLDKDKILRHLHNFKDRLVEEENLLGSANVSKLADLPKLNREKVVSKIISNYPQFEGLYNDHRQITDIYSLETTKSYIKLALSADPNVIQGQLIITRVLQVIGEYVKNTLESPKMSDTTSELFLLSLPKNTRKVITGLRNSLSHAFSLSKRTEIEQNTDVNFFVGIQNDMKKLADVITDILHNSRMKMIRILLQKVVNSQSSNEMKEVAVVFNDVGIDEMFSGEFSNDFKVSDHEKLERLVNELSDKITDKTRYETELFVKINNMIGFVKNKSENIITDYITAFSSLKGINVSFNDNIDSNAIRGMKFFANKALENIAPRIESQNLKEIAEMIVAISLSASSRTQHDNNKDEMDKLAYEIVRFVEFEVNDIKWIEKTREKLLKGSFISNKYNKVDCENKTKEKHNQLVQKLSELKDILGSNGLDERLFEKFPSYKSDKQLQAVIEMLVLDIMSILGASQNCLQNNLLFLDDNFPLLTGKCLRDHLAHHNALVDVLLPDPSIAIVLNALKLTEAKSLRGEKKIGKLLPDDPPKLKHKHDQHLAIISNQNRMFRALEVGNLEDLKECLKNGADIKARSIDSCTALHFAAKEPGLEVVKFILTHDLEPNMKDVNGQTPLYVAAAYGRNDVVEFLLKQTKSCFDDPDDSGKTPLHIAAQNGHEKIVQILLKNKASTNIHDQLGFSPLHSAIKYNHLNVAKLLLVKEVDVDVNEAMGGFTSLHIAAEMGHLDVVNFLLKNKAKVNARTDGDTTPIHLAALNGHLQVVRALILKGADVNAAVLDGCTPLHYAVETGREDVANLLLEHGAKVDVYDKTYRNTPLHYAAKDGHGGILRSLLEYKANARLATLEGITPLHFAVQGGHLKIVCALIQHGVNVNAIDNKKLTPLHYAASYARKEIAEILMKHGAEVNAKAYEDFTPLHVACNAGHEDVAELLIKSKADINARDMKGRAALHVAVMKGNIDIINMLIKHNAEVDAKDMDGLTPLQLAAGNGHGSAIVTLIENKADVNPINKFGITALHAAAMTGHTDVVEVLIKNSARVDGPSVNTNNITPLHAAVEAGHKEVVEVLIAAGADINAKMGNSTPLYVAVKRNRKEIAEVLLANGATVNDNLLRLASFAGYEHIVEILLKNKASVNAKGPVNVTPLHIAAMKGHKAAVNALIKGGADIDAKNVNNATPLLLAANDGHEDIVETLIKNGADVNLKADDGVTALNTAATNGHTGVVRILLNNKVNVNARDAKNRTALEMAVAHGRLQVVKVLLQCKEVDVNAKGNDDWTILHIASQGSDLEIVKCLVSAGCDINARNASGTKAVHIAAREGFREALEFFFSKGVNINDPGAANQTVLHYSAIKGSLEIAKYLIEKGADVNVKDGNNLTPLHIAAIFGYRDLVKVLLEKGAIYNAVDVLGRKPLGLAKDKGVINLLTSTEKLFEAVKNNKLPDVEVYIKAEACVNAKNRDKATPLHYAAWKGYQEIVEVLLRNKADPNAVGNNGWTPLHYAAKFSHLKIILSLLSNGAVYNAVSDRGKAPLDFTEHASISSLFNLVNDSFNNVKHNNARVITDLDKIKDIQTVKAVMCARNRQNETLVVAALHNNFPKVKQLKELKQGDVSTHVNVALALSVGGDHQRAMSILKSILEKRESILGTDNPGTLDIQVYIAKVVFKQGLYREALAIYEDILRKQKKILGPNHSDALSTRSGIALVLYRQDRNQEAFDIYKEIYQKQKELLGTNHSDTVETRFHMALVLDKLGKYEEALSANEAVYKNKQSRGVG